MASDLLVKLAKYANIVLNTGFLLSGVLLIAVGVFAYLEGIEGFSSQYITIGLIVIGVIFALVSILGFFGFVRGNKNLVWAYIGLVVFFAVVEIGLAITAYSMKDDFPSIAYSTWQHLVYYDPKAIITVEQNLECCGWYNYSDFALPPSCHEAEGFGFLTGCQAPVDAAVEEAYLAAGAIAATLAALQLFSLLVAGATLRYLKPSNAPQELIEEEFDDV